MKRIFLPALAVAFMFSCQSKAPVTSTLSVAVAPAQPERNYRAEADKFISEYTATYQKLYYMSSEAEWASNTRIVAGDNGNAERTMDANTKMAQFTGSIDNIQTTQELLKHRTELDNLQILQLEAILYKAANNPQSIQETVNQRIKAETEQSEKLYGFNYTLDGKPVTTNRIDEILKDEKNLSKRLKAWNASKEVGPTLKEGLLQLRDLRNKTVNTLGYKDYFSYQASEYGMTKDEMLEMVKRLNEELMPLYRELHTYARYEMAKKYGVKNVPDMLPAHWLPNRWGQDWSSMVNVKGLDLDKALKAKGSEWQVRQAEKFYTSLGFPELPGSFYEQSSLYPVPANAGYKKNNHASAWHLDLENDVRSLMSVEPNAEWYETTHHELGHIYYYISYTNDKVPVLLRTGANRAYHEAVGSLMGLAASQKPFVAQLGLVDKNAKTDEIQTLLKEALNYVVFIPFASGVMTEYEHDLYADNLPAEQLNQRWWELVGKYQGIAPPSRRSEEYCDAATKTHINDDPAQYYDYALSYIILFQLHNHIANTILKQDPHATNYYGNKEVGAFLKRIMEPGATADWRKLLIETTGQEMNAKAMVEYFQPLMAYLQQQNKGRKYTM